MAGDLSIRPATPEDTSHILHLVKLSLGEGNVPRHSDYWSWKHHENPFGPSPCLVAEAEGQIVGLRVFMRWTWKARGITFPAVRAVDTATHPEWRGKGIFTRLTLALVERMKAEEVAFVFNTPNNRSRPGYLKMGWTSLGRTSLWVRPIRPVKLLRSWLSSWRAQSGPEYEISDQSSGVPAGDLVQHPEFPRLVDSLPDSTDGFSTPRSREYLRWRYVAIPGLDYRAAWRREGEHGAAIIFRCKTKQGLRELRLCELLVADTSRSVRIGKELLQSLVRRAPADYATGMAVVRSAAQHILLRCGFLPAPRLGPIMTVRPLNVRSNGLDPLARSDWDLSIGDLELF